MFAKVRGPDFKRAHSCAEGIMMTPSFGIEGSRNTVADTPSSAFSMSFPPILTGNWPKCNFRTSGRSPLLGHPYLLDRRADDVRRVLSLRAIRAERRAPGVAWRYLARRLWMVAKSISNHNVGWYLRGAILGGAGLRPSTVGIVAGKFGGPVRVVGRNGAFTRCFCARARPPWLPPKRNQPGVASDEAPQCGSPSPKRLF